MDSDRDILIEMRTKVNDIHFNMTQPGGKVPNLETTVSRHEKQLTTIHAGLGVWKYLISGFGILLMAFGAALVAHFFGWKGP